MWRVSKETSLSDPRYIKFLWFSERSTAKPSRNPRQTNWELYKTMLARVVCDRDLKYKSVADLEELVRIVCQAIILAYESSCSLKVPKGNKGKIGGRESYRNSVLRRGGVQQGPLQRDQQNWDAHADLQRRYKYSVLAAQKKGWEDYYERIKGYLEAARLKRTLAGKPGGWLESVLLQNGDYAEAEEECLKLLFITHFLGSREEEEEARPRYRWATRTSWGTARKILTPERIR